MLSIFLVTWYLIYDLFLTPAWGYSRAPRKSSLRRHIGNRNSRVEGREDEVERDRISEEKKLYYQHICPVQRGKYNFYSLPLNDRYNDRPNGKPIHCFFSNLPALVIWLACSLRFLEGMLCLLGLAACISTFLFVSPRKVI